MIYSKILGTGSYLPETILTNHELEQRLDTTSEWILSRTGINARHIAASHETASSMALAASNLALATANIAKKDIGLIIVATTTPDYIFPGSACLLQQGLGIAEYECPAFDLNSAACAGFIYALSIADQYIKTGAIRYALIVGSELMSRLVDWKDRATCILFGDGAGAVVLGASQEPGVLSTHLHSNGAYREMLYLANNVACARSGAKTVMQDYIKMQGNPLFKVAVNTLEKLFDETLAAHAIKNIDWLIPHQANIRIIQAMAKKLNLPLSQVVVTLGTQGNTSSASIPLALDHGIRQTSILPGQTLLLEGFGGGLVWGSALVIA